MYLTSSGAGAWPLGQPAAPAQPQRQTPQCPRYASREVAISRTEAGHIKNDIFVRPGRVVIRDFGVGSSRLKRSAATNPALTEWIKRWEADGSYRLRITGFSDCVGAERNLKLRKARAESVLKALGPTARSRIDSIGPAPADEYRQDNGTVAGRAMNRSVVIEFYGKVDFAPEPVTGTTPRNLYKMMLEALDQQKSAGFPLHPETTKRLKCVLKFLLANSNADDRFVSYSALFDRAKIFGKRKLEPRDWDSILAKLRDTLWTAKMLTKPKEFLSYLLRVDEEVVNSIQILEQRYQNDQSAMDRGLVEVKDWIHSRQRDKNSIYSCYAG